MTETYFPEGNETLTLDQFVERLEASGVVPELRASRYTPEAMSCVAEWMAALARDPDVLRGLLVDGLADFLNYQVDNDFKPSTLMLHKGDGYSLRAVLWMPPSPQHPPEIFSYYETHDHSFDFFTVGAFGPGYRTQLYDYEYENVRGVPGELVPLRFQEETGLPPGKVMYYYGSRDIHTQLPAPSISASINLLLPKTYPAHRRQYEMTLEETPEGVFGKLIAGNVDRQAQERALFETAAAMGDTDLHEALRDIARHHDTPQVRALAWQSLLPNSKHLAEDVGLVRDDGDPHVRAALSQWV